MNHRKILLNISTPIYFEWLFTLSMGAIDIWLLSKISDSVAAAVGAALVLTTLTVTALATLGNGGTIVIAKLLGGGNIKASKKASTCLMILMLIFGMLLSFLYITLSAPLLDLLNIPSNLAKDVLIFWYISGAGTWIYAIYWTLTSIANAHHKTKLGMYGALIGNCLNTVLILLLSFGFGFLPALGITGAAIALLVSRTFATGMTYILFKQQINNAFHTKNLLLCLKRYTKQILDIAVPTMAEPVSYHIGQVVVLSFIAGLGVHTLASRTYVTQIIDLAGITPFALACGCQFLLSHSIGGKNYDEARIWYSTALSTAMLFVSGTVSLLYIFADELLSIFTSDPTILALSKPLIFIGAIVLIIKSFNFITSACLRACGFASYSTGVSIFSSWIVGVPLAYLLGIHYQLGLIGIFVAAGVDELTRCALYSYRWIFRKEQVFNKLNLA